MRARVAYHSAAQRRGNENGQKNQQGDRECPGAPLSDIQLSEDIHCYFLTFELIENKSKPPQHNKLDRWRGSDGPGDMDHAKAVWCRWFGARAECVFCVRFEEEYRVVIKKR